MTKELTIRLDSNFSMFTVAQHSGFQYIGRVERGMEVGALALTPEGEYVQVNGSVVTPLNKSRVLATLRKLQGGRYVAMPTPRPDPMTIADFLPPAAPAQAPVPVIVKRKKRIVVMP